LNISLGATQVLISSINFSLVSGYFLTANFVNKTPRSDKSLVKLGSSNPSGAGFSLLLTLVMMIFSLSKS